MRVVVVVAILALCVSASAQSLADAAAKEAARRATIKDPAKIYTDRDLPEAGQAVPAKHAPTTAGDGKTAASARRPGQTVATDDNGHDEQWWKARADALRRKLSEATMRLEIARKRGDAVAAEMDRSGSIARPSTMRGVHDATAEVDRRAAEVRSAGRALDDLEDEARRAGALPGWLRK